MVMGSYEVEAHAVAPREVVFAVLDDAPGWAAWAGFTVASARWEREGDPPPGGPGAIRRVGRWPLFGREQILERTEPTHMAYTVLSGVPVRGYHADIDLHDDSRAGTGATRIVWRASFEPRVPGTAGLMSWWLRRLIGGYARRAAAEAERRVANE